MLFDVKRKDFWEMQLHHFTTALLMTFSYTSGMHRIGALILFVHDISDVFLEWAKGTNYIWEGSAATSIFFALFAGMFFVCRLIVYPFWMVLITMKYSDHDFCHREWWGLDFMGLLLSTLLCLHMFWMYLITNILIKAITGGAIQDSREDADSEEDGGVDEKKGN
jgi:ceramide synthetase